MKCPECGENMTKSRGDYDYSIVGLPVLLVNVELRLCPTHGLSPAIPRIEQLHKMIAQGIVTKTSRLSGAEVKFLRKHIGWSGQDFARHIGVTPACVSRWENDHEQIGEGSDRALRLMAIIHEPVCDYPAIDALEMMAKIHGAPVVRKIKLKAERNDWVSIAL